MGTVRQRLGERVTGHREQVSPPEGSGWDWALALAGALGEWTRPCSRLSNLSLGPTRPQRAVKGTPMLPFLGEKACPGVPGRV